MTTRPTRSLRSTQIWTSNIPDGGGLCVACPRR
nr:MAG TPA: hypothetical protein [Caudoviricetes sp.]